MRPLGLGAWALPERPDMRTRGMKTSGMLREIAARLRLLDEWKRAWDHYRLRCVEEIPRLLDAEDVCVDEEGQFSYCGPKEEWPQYRELDSLYNELWTTLQQLPFDTKPVRDEVCMLHDFDDREPIANWLKETESIQDRVEIALQRVRARLANEEVGTARASGLMSATELARKHGVNPEALRKRLERWRRQQDGGWVQVVDRRVRGPKYLYDEGAVQTIIAALKKARFPVAEAISTASEGFQGSPRSVRPPSDQGKSGSI